MRAPRSIVLTAIATTLVLGTAACGDSATSAGSSAAKSAASSGSAAVRDADRAFAAGMIPHHEQAVEMSQLAKTRAASPEVRKLAATIEAAQAPEIEQMKGWLDSWGAGSHGSMSGGHGGHSGMLSDDKMKDLEASSGAEFDRLFLEGMIEHHDGAVAMAKKQLDEGADPDARALAEAIIRSQTAEIEQMRTLLQQVG